VRKTNSDLLKEQIERAKVRAERSNGKRRQSDQSPESSRGPSFGLAVDMNKSTTTHTHNHYRGSGRSSTTSEGSTSGQISPNHVPHSNRRSRRNGSRASNVDIAGQDLSANNLPFRNNHQDLEGQGQNNTLATPGGYMREIDGLARDGGRAIGLDERHTHFIRAILNAIGKIINDRNGHNKRQKKIRDDKIIADAEKAEILAEKTRIENIEIERQRNKRIHKENELVVRNHIAETQEELSNNVRDLEVVVSNVSTKSEVANELLAQLVVRNTDINNQLHEIERVQAASSKETRIILMSAINNSVKKMDEHFIKLTEKLTETLNKSTTDSADHNESILEVNQTVLEAIVFIQAEITGIKNDVGTLKERNKSILDWVKNSAKLKNPFESSSNKIRLSSGDYVQDSIEIRNRKSSGFELVQNWIKAIFIPTSSDIPTSPVFTYAPTQTEDNPSSPVATNVPTQTEDTTTTTVVTNEIYEDSSADINIVRIPSNKKVNLKLNVERKSIEASSSSSMDFLSPLDKKDDGYFQEVIENRDTSPNSSDGSHYAVHGTMSYFFTSQLPMVPVPVSCIQGHPYLGIFMFSAMVISNIKISFDHDDFIDPIPEFKNYVEF